MINMVDHVRTLACVLCKLYGRKLTVQSTTQK